MRRACLNLFLLMKPVSLLSEKDYDNLLHGLRNAPSPSDFLRACESDYLPTNQDFYKLLLKAVGRAKPQGELNAFLILNPGYPMQEAKRMLYGNLIELEELIMNRAFAQMPGLEKAAKEFGKGMAEIAKRIKAAMEAALKFHELHRARFAELAEIWKAFKQEHERGYNSKMGTMAVFLQQELGLVPESYLEFCQWHFHVSDLADIPLTPENIKRLATVTEADFWEFSEHKKAKARELIEARKRGKAGLTNNKPAVSEPPAFADLFASPEAMEKALAAARHARLINEADVWIFTGYKTHAVSLFWVAAIAAGLAKADVSGYRVSECLKSRFKMRSLGKNAIDRTAKPSKFDTEQQRLYNELLAFMGR